jgi:hypothetical protein
MHYIVFLPIDYNQKLSIFNQMDKEKKHKGSIFARFMRIIGLLNPHHKVKNTLIPEVNYDRYTLDELIKLSDHRFGFEREKVVVLLGDTGHSDAVPVVLLRCNDWVKQVRIAAKQALLKLAIAKNASTFIGQLPVLYHLRNCGRENHDKLIEAIECYLTSDANKQLLVAGIANTDIKISKWSFLLVLKSRVLKTKELLEIGLTHNNVAIRLKCSGLIGELNAESRKQALSVAINDKFMPVRRVALKGLIVKGVTDDFIKLFLFDKHSSIREIAINQLQHLDLSSIYYRELESHSAFMVACSIWGLVTLNQQKYLADIVKQLTNLHPSVRKQALITITKLNGFDAEKIVFKHFNDESPKVAKEASRLAAKLNIILSAKELLTLYKSNHYYNSLTACSSILKRMNKWEHLIFILTLLDEKHGAESEESKQIEIEIHHWSDDFNRVHNQPTEKQIELISKLYLRNCDFLNKYLNKVFMFTLKSFGVRVE